MQAKSNFIAVCVIYLGVFSSLMLLRVLGALRVFSGLDEVWADLIFSLLVQVVIMVLLPVFGMLYFRMKRGQKTAPEVSFSAYLDAKKSDPDAKIGGAGGLFEDSTIEQIQGAKNQKVGLEAKRLFKSWGFNRPSAKVVGFAFLLGFLMFFFNIYVSSFFNGVLGLFGFRHMSGGGFATGVEFSIWMLFFTLFIGAILPGFCEEVTHRGMLLKGFSDRVGIMRAVMISSLLFGLLHMNAVQVFYCIVLGYLMGIAIVATRSIWTGVIMHFVNNALAVYLGFASIHGLPLGNMFGFIEGLGMIGFAGVVLLFVVLYTVIMFIIERFARDNYIKDAKKNLKEGDELVLPANVRGGHALRFYFSAMDKKDVTSPSRLSAIEKTLLYGLVFLGVAINVMSIAWGFL